MSDATYSAKMGQLQAASVIIDSDAWLATVRDIFRSWDEIWEYCNHPGNVLSIPGPGGHSRHRVMFSDDSVNGGGPHLTIGYNLPYGVYAEIEDGTYGELQRFRIYRGDA